MPVSTSSLPALDPCEPASRCLSAQEKNQSRLSPLPPSPGKEEAIPAPGKTDMMTARKDLPTEAWSAFSQIVEGMDAPTSQSNQGSANLASDEMKDVGECWQLPTRSLIPCTVLCLGTSTPKGWTLSLVSAGWDQHMEIKAFSPGASLVVQWLRVRLAKQGTLVQSLVQEDSTHHKTAKPGRHNFESVL